MIFNGTSNLLGFAKTDNGNLCITLLPEGRGCIKELREDHPNMSDDEIFLELAEYQLCNGWSLVAPEDIGALTGAMILSDDVGWNEEGKIVACGTVYSEIDFYQVRSTLSVLEAEGEVIWKGTE